MVKNIVALLFVVTMLIGAMICCYNLGLVTSEERHMRSCMNYYGDISVREARNKCAVLLKLNS